MPSAVSPASRTPATVDAVSRQPGSGVGANSEADLSPIFVYQPRNETVSVGGTGGFIALAEGVPEPAIQWQMSTDSGLTWTNLVESTAFTGTTQGELNVNAVTISESGLWFRLMATNSEGIEFSDPAILTVVVGSIPTIVQQPDNAGAVIGSVAQFATTIAGTPTPSVQWQISDDGSDWRDLSDDAIFAGATTTTLTVTPINVELNGSLVRMSATNSAGTAISAPAILSVSTDAVAPSIIQQPQDGAVFINSTSFSVVAVGAPTPMYQWQLLTSNGWIDLQDNGDPNDPPTIVYAGSKTSTLTITVTCCGRLFFGTPIIGEEVRAVITNEAGSVVTATADVVNAPTMQFDRSALAFGAIERAAAFSSQTPTQTIRMTQTGLGQLPWTAASNQPWLVVTPSSGSGSATLSVSITWTPGLTATQHGIISITLPGLTFLPANPFLGPPVINIPVSLGVLPTNTAIPPFGAFDSPTNGSTGVAGSVAVSGWALDNVEVTGVTICRDAVPGDVVAIESRCNNFPKVFIGNAVFVDGARPDVQAQFPGYPLSSRGGWGYLLLTNFLPAGGNGTFTLYAYASDAGGYTTQLGTKTIMCDNAHATTPFGAIDTPTQGGVVSGTFANGGWVLTQSPKDIPADSSTVTAFIDGAPIGNLDPGRIARADITSLFSATYDTTHAAGGKIIDTTVFANGVHTIFWVATDTGNQTGGIGSRFFTISNGSDIGGLSSDVVASSKAATVIASASKLEAPASSSHPASLDAEVAAAPLNLDPVQGRRGFNLDRPLQTYTPSTGHIDVQSEELDRIELHLSPATESSLSGYQRTPSGLRPLPVGSALNASTGTFTWSPGVGFYGPYDLAFVQWNNGHAVARQDVRITLNAKGSNRIGPQTLIDAPGENALVGSSFYVGGWAADLASTVDSGVNTVHVWAYPIDPKDNRLDPFFLGPAIYGGARPDVGAVYGQTFTNSGYGMIVNRLPPGTYDIAVFAYSTVLNSFTPAKVVRVTVR